MSQKEFQRVKVNENAAGARHSASNAAIRPIPLTGCGTGIADAPCLGHRLGVTESRCS
jgi:hypothetical protein